MSNRNRRRRQQALQTGAEAAQAALGAWLGDDDDGSGTLVVQTQQPEIPQWMMLIGVAVVAGLIVKGL